MNDRITATWQQDNSNISVIFWKKQSPLQSDAWPIKVSVVFCALKMPRICRTALWPTTTALYLALPNLMDQRTWTYYKTHQNAWQLPWIISDIRSNLLPRWCHPEDFLWSGTNVLWAMQRGKWTKKHRNWRLLVSCTYWHNVSLLITVNISAYQK